MILRGLIPLLQALPEYKEVIDPLLGGDTDYAKVNLLEGAKPYWFSAFAQEARASVLILVAEPYHAKRVYEQLTIWTGDLQRVHLFPSYRGLFYDRGAADPGTNQRRLAALDALSTADGGVVVADLRAAMQRLPAPSRLTGKRFTIRRGDRISPQALLERLVGMGYEAATMVVEMGLFARRGGIVDFFSPTSERPTRVEFFGDEVDSIRLFDPLTQRSESKVDEAVVAPPRELTPAVAADLVQALAGVDTSSLSEAAKERWEGDLAALDRGDLPFHVESYVPYIGTASLMDYAGERCVVLVDEPERLARTAFALAEEAEEFRQELESRGELPRGLPKPYFDWNELEPRLGARRRLELASEGQAASDAIPQPDFGVLPSYGGRLRVALDDLTALVGDGLRVVVASHQADRLRELLESRGVTSLPVEEVLDPPQPGRLVLVRGTLHEGWQSSSLGLALFTDAELFGTAKPRPVVRRRRQAPPVLLSDLALGDYVVHVDHGVGRYQGTTRMGVDGAERDYLVLEYADGDRMFVPTDQADRVSKYHGTGEAEPTLHRLGTGEWARAKERVKASARDIAKELLEIYAARELAAGHAFSPDTPWQSEMEAAFPYVETPDQLQAVAEVKMDMERARPMDRLVCGDVGYGKTEVAIRAAFKAVMDGKQVAVLVPTTVLAQQHYATFTERLRAFPVRVEVLSRFRSPREQKRVVAEVAAGTVDICIGTHRLLQKDVAFKNLGLLVIDEEHRFGVAHKEQLKRLKREVDVLTLSATPIPRTLQMSLAGVRDMSTIATPPEERLPIKTYLGEYREQVVREAILRELDRGGQVFFVHNRVHGLDLVAREIRRLVPEAKVAMAHGQMREDKLERIMLDFAGGAYDVLVCTTIIESGLDMPNVNTIIVNQAERFGLAQLYQLRGRVGRASERAYAYLLFSRNRRLTPVAEKRLRTIFEASDLGAGLQIALKDLEIRGAGNLLGAEQHGHIAAVGFDLYTRLIAEAVRELQGKPRTQERLPQVTLDVPLDAYIPAEYVADEALRLSLYQRLAGVVTMEAAGQIALEISDRFGTPPEPVLNLLYLVQLKVAAAMAGVQAVIVNDSQVVVHFFDGSRIDRPGLLRRFGSCVRLSPNMVRLDRRCLREGWQSAVQAVVDAAAAAPVLVRQA